MKFTIKSSHRKSLFLVKERAPYNKDNIAVFNYGDKTPMKALFQVMGENEFRINFPSHLIWQEKFLLLSALNMLLLKLL